AALRQGATKAAADVLQRFRAMPALNALTGSPLLLTGMAQVHRQRGQSGLPQRRVAVYAWLCQHLVSCWQPKPDPAEAQKRLATLKALAVGLMRRKGREFKLAEADKLLAPLIEGGDVEGFLRGVQKSGALLVERDLGVWRFAHQLLQEHLA